MINDLAAQKGVHYEQFSISGQSSKLLFLINVSLGNEHRFGKTRYESITKVTSKENSHF